jgi:hypothetical protein
MKKPALFVVLLLGCFGCMVVTGFFYFRFSEHRKQLQVDVSHKQFAARVTQLQQSLPLGTSRQDVIRYLQKSAMTFDDSQPRLYVKLGTVPSTAWYCSTWSTYAVFTFEGDSPTNASNGTLKQLLSEERGDTCL